jgi:hypothetical protein
MGWSFRRSAKFGPFRINFSKSGIGVSTGVKGARISTGPRGTYVNLGGSGVYYRQKVGGTLRGSYSTAGQQSHQSAHQATLPPIASQLSAYPTFPKHGFPRIVKTLSILFAVAVITLMWAWAFVSTSNISQPTPLYPPLTQQALTNNNSVSDVEPTKSAPDTASFRRGLKVGSQSGRADGKRPDRAEMPGQTDVEMRARVLARKGAKDNDWQRGWVAGYKQGFMAVSEGAKRQERTVSTSNNPASLSRPRYAESLPTPLRYSSRYIRGPRGGCYYITGSGRKQYVDRSRCN